MDKALADIYKASLEIEATIREGMPSRGRLTYIVRVLEASFKRISKYTERRERTDTTKDRIFTRAVLKEEFIEIVEEPLMEAIRRHQIGLPPEEWLDNEGEVRMDFCLPALFRKLCDLSRDGDLGWRWFLIPIHEQSSFALGRWAFEESENDKFKEDLIRVSIGIWGLSFSSDRRKKYFFTKNYYE